MIKKLIAGLFLITLSAHAALPEYQAPVLLARANIADGFNLPPMSHISNPTPSINNRGDVTFKLMAFDGQTDQGLWLKLFDEENGKIIYTAPNSRFITDPTINNSGQVVFNLYDEGITDGLFVLDGSTQKVDQVLKPDDKDVAFYTYSQILDNGNIFFRGTNESNERTFYEYNGSLKKIISEGTESYGKKSSYLFRPMLNLNGVMVFKRRLGETGEWDESNGDELLMLKPKAENVYEPIVIARDQDADPDSFYKSFSNSISVSNNGLVAFTAVLEDSHRALVMYKDGILRNLAIEKADDILEIELFTPMVNDQGLVAFRARDLEGKRALYVASTEGIKKLITEGDELMTDQGLAKILSNPNYPGFTGEIDINDSGDIIFTCLLVSAKDEKELGTALFKFSQIK